MRYSNQWKGLAGLFVVLCLLAMQSAVLALPLVDLNADELPLGSITNWTNTGTLGGSFTNDASGPTVVNYSGKRCIYFDGNDRMKSTFNAPAGITGNGTHSVAVWVFNPSIGTDETLVEWAKGGVNGRDARFNHGTNTSYGAVYHYGTAYNMGVASGTMVNNRWQHVCYTHDGTTTRVYVDGVLKASKNMTLDMYTALPIYIGVGRTSTNGYTKYLTGYIASVQIYDDVLNQSQITGLVGRGSEVYYHNEALYADSDPNVNVRSSQHVRIVWGKNDTSGLMTEAYVQGNLYMFENCWKKYYVEMGFKEPRESVDPAYRDGRWYKVNVIVGATGLANHQGGGNFLGFDNRSFGYVITDPWAMRWDPPSGATPHEYAHVYQVHAEGFNGSPSGFWWECHANWMMLQFLNNYPDTWLINQRSWWYQSHGTHYYDNWQIFEYLMEQPEYGYNWINTLWTQGNGEWILDAMARLDTGPNPDKVDQVKDNFNHMAARNVTWDYGRRSYFAASDTNEDKWRMGRCDLRLKPGSSTVWRVPWEMAPQQMGYNIIPLNMPGKTGSAWTVTANLTGYCNTARGTDCWRAQFVAVNSSGTPRYSSQWHSGSNSITLGSSENTLYLVVSGTPNFLAVGPGDDFKGLSKEQFPYELTFSNAVPYEYAWPVPGVAYHYHSNGGGIVANTATVDSTAYVGPNAMVLGSAQVRNSARIEDYARVEGSAQVRDYAIVSGHAWVKDTAQVYGYAKVRDYAAAKENSRAYGNARILERANLIGNVKVCDNATVKGGTFAWDATGSNYINGYSIWDGDAADGVATNDSVHIGWLKGQEWADGQPDTNGIYCCYNFQTAHNAWIMDRYGIVHGWPVGGPSIVTDADLNRDKVLTLNGSSQYVELRRDVCDFKDTTIMGWVYWTGSTTNQRIFSFGDGANKYMYLTPKDGTSNTVKFVISNGGSTQSLTGSAQIPLNTWTHVAVVLNGNTGKLFVGGSPVATGTVSIDPDQLLPANLNNAPACNYLGRSPAGNYFQGRIDDFRVYVRPLSDNEVTTIATESLRTVPQMNDLLFACDTDSFPASGATGPWIPFYPAGLSLANMASPTVAVIDGKKWDYNLYADGDGYNFGNFTSPIPCNGATIVVAVKPVRNSTSTPWTSIVDAFYNNLVLGLKNNTGEICVWRNGVLNNTGVTIPDGQKTVLSLVVQSNGTYKVFANGTQVVNVTATSTYTQIAPGVEPYMKNINVGRNNPDGWTTFNGYIGDVFFYKVALTDVDRQALENDVMGKFGILSRNVPQPNELVFSCDTDVFPASGNTGPWPTYYPTGMTLATMGSPTVETLDNKKWERNIYADGDGYNFGSFVNPIPCNGASVVMAVRPIRNGTWTDWTSCFDAFYNNLVLGVRNDTGIVTVWRNAVRYTSATAIPDAQKTVLSLVVQPNGTFKVFANGTEIMNVTAQSTYTQIAPGAQSYMKNINVGRNHPDGWTVFNGHIGDVFFYKVALTDAERQMLEADIRAKFGF